MTESNGDIVLLKDGSKVIILDQHHEFNNGFVALNIIDDKCVDHNAFIVNFSDCDRILIPYFPKWSTIYTQMLGGGAHLGAARTFIQRKPNGSSVTWGSDTEIRTTVDEIEELSNEIATAVIGELLASLKGKRNIPNSKDEIDWFFYANFFSPTTDLFNNVATKIRNLSVLKALAITLYQPYQP